LTKARSELLANGYLYPDVSDNFKKVLAGIPTAGNGLVINVALRRDDPGAAIKLVEKYASSAHHLILSCEGFSSRSQSTLEQFARGLRAFGYDLRCLVFFRPQVEMVVSAYLQETKANSSRVEMPLRTYVERYFNTKKVRKTWNWYDRAQKLSHIFGKSNVTVKWYPAMRRQGADGVVSAAFNWLGSQQLFEQVRADLSASAIINPTPGQEALTVLHKANANGFGGRLFADEFLNRASAKGLLGARVTLDTNQLKQLHADTYKDNRRLLEEYCASLLPATELAEPIVTPASVEDHHTLAALNSIACEVLTQQKQNLRVREQIKALFGHPPIQAAKEKITNIPSGDRTKPAAPPARFGRRCIIHIGMHKTGSTSIQESLCGFEDGRTVYADLAAHGNHSLPIYSLFSDQPERHHLHQNAGRNQEAIRLYNESVGKRLDSSASALGRRTLLISGEDIAVLNRADLVKMRKYLEARFDEVEIVAYVRAPAGYITSSFQQKIKGGRVNSFDLADMYRSYRASFEKFDAIFGREHVHLWKFDPSKFPNGDVVQDFCARLDISFLNRKAVRLNESLSRQAVAALYTYNRFADQNGANRLKGRDLVTLGKLLDGDKFRLSAEALRPVLEANRSDIEWMEARLGTSLNEDLGEAQPTDIRDEADLLGPDPRLVSQLMGHLRRSVPTGVTGEKPEDVALLVESLYKRHRYFGAGDFLSRIYKRRRRKEHVG
jgi:hypothetical protein